MKIHIFGRNALNCALYLEFNEFINPFNLKIKIRNVGDEFILKLYESFLNYLELDLNVLQKENLYIIFKKIEKEF